MANAFGGTPDGSLEAMLQIGASKADSAVGAASSGLDAVISGGGQIRADASSMRDQASLVNAQGDSVNLTASEIAKLATTLSPYADKLGGYGDELDALSSLLVSQSNDNFGQASFLMGMNPNATGLAGEFMKHYGSLSPDKYVSRAASDVQGSADNALAQNERALARRGVNVGSGAGLGMRQQYSRMLAELTSAAKTKAWDEGNKAQGAFLEKMTGAAKTFYDMGTGSMSQALTAKGAAGDMQKGAAAIVQSQGDLLQSAGSLQASAGQLFATSANIFGSAANVENDYLDSLSSAYKTLSGAWESAANYYLNAAGREIDANTSGRGGGAVVSSSDGDDWGNWKGTGHSQTWNKNNNPDYWTLANNGAES